LLPYGLSVRALAESLGVSPSTITRVINGASAVSPEMALRLAKALGRSPESWLAMQHSYDLWQARKVTDLSHVRHIEFAA
jgi:addiction module HigA family antidote